MTDNEELDNQLKEMLPEAHLSDTERINMVVANMHNLVQACEAMLIRIEKLEAKQ